MEDRSWERWNQLGRVSANSYLYAVTVRCRHQSSPKCQKPSQNVVHTTESDVRGNASARFWLHVLKCPYLHNLTCDKYFPKRTYLLFQMYLGATAEYRISFGISPRTKDEARGAAEEKGRSPEVSEVHILRPHQVLGVPPHLRWPHAGRTPV